MEGWGTLPYSYCVFLIQSAAIHVVITSSHQSSSGTNISVLSSLHSCVLFIYLELEPETVPSGKVMVKLELPYLVQIMFWLFGNGCVFVGQDCNSGPIRD